MCVKWWTVKCGVLPVLATEQPPYYITQSSCLVEHIIRLCHQLQQNVCIRSTAVLCHAETLKWWRASCGRKYHEPEYYFHCPRAKNPQKQIYPQPQLWMILCMLSFPFFPCCCWSCAACQNAQRSGYCWTAVQATSDSCNPKRTAWKFSSSAC